LPIRLQAGCSPPWRENKPAYLSHPALCSPRQLVFVLNVTSRSAGCGRSSPRADPRRRIRRSVSLSSCTIRWCSPAAMTRFGARHWTLSSPLCVAALLCLPPKPQQIQVSEPRAVELYFSPDSPFLMSEWPLARLDRAKAGANSPRLNFTVPKPRPTRRELPLPEWDLHGGFG